MPAPSIKSVVRAILSTDLNLPANEVIKLAKQKGVRAPDANIRMAVHNVKSDLKRKVIQPTPAPAAARETPKPAAARDLTVVLANVALVNQVVSAAGGIDQARQVAEAVRACDGVDAFLQHLELIADIRGEVG